jgi:hypothetical protein
MDDKPRRGQTPSSPQSRLAALRLERLSRKRVENCGCCSDARHSADGSGGLFVRVAPKPEEIAEIYIDEGSQNNLGCVSLNLTPAEGPIAFIPGFAAAAIKRHRVQTERPR